MPSDRDESSHDSDSTAMQRLQSGEDLALNELIDRWRLPLLSFTQRAVSNHSDAEDIAQETFVRIYRYRHRYQPSQKFSTWLFNIANNLVKNHYRWRSRHPETLVAEDDTSAAAESISSIEGKENSHVVQHHINKLPQKMRTAVVLYYFEEMPQAEIAQVIGKSEKAVESILYRARKQLENALIRQDNNCE